MNLRDSILLAVVLVSFHASAQTRVEPSEPIPPADASADLIAALTPPEPSSPSDVPRSSEPKPTVVEKVLAPAKLTIGDATLKLGFGEGIAFESASGNLKLSLRARAQIRGDAVVPSGSNASRLNELIVRRAQLGVRAEFLKDWRFELGLAFANRELESDLPSPLLDASGTWAMLRDLNVKLGQATVPFGRQQVTSDSAQQFADRSIVVSELSLDRDVGLTIRSDDLFGFGKRFAYQAGVQGGDGRNRLGTNSGLLYFVRAQVAPFGGFDDNVESDLKRTPQPRVAFGVSYARNNATIRARSTSGALFKNGSVTYDHGALDLAFKWRGISLVAEGMLRKADRDQLVGAMNTEWSRSGWGYFVQAGYLPFDQIEVAARFGDLHPFAGTDPNFLRQRELGGAISYYAFKHDLKVQADYFWLASGERFENGAHQVRLQLQVYF